MHLQQVCFMLCLHINLGIQVEKLSATGIAVPRVHRGLGKFQAPQPVWKGFLIN
jgi:hypothetical protein